jgi:sugar/nucleoside kinase (ribokinase family)
MRGGPVLSIGETLIDLIAADGAVNLQDANAFVARTGGAPANVAVALARLGVPSAFCGVVGADPFGEKLKLTLGGYGVDVSRVRSTDEADTTIAFAWKDGRGDGHFRLLRMADRLLSEADVEAARAPETAAVVLGSVSLSAEPSRRAVHRAAEIAAAANVPVCFDVNMRPSLWRSAAEALHACEPILAAARLLKMSLDDGRALYPGVEDPAALLAAVRDAPARFIVITDGERGAWFVDRKRDRDADLEFVARFNVNAVEPTGAGDAFTAAVISRLIDRDWTALTAPDVRYGSAAGALATTRPGAMEALPARADIERFLESVS